MSEQRNIATDSDRLRVPPETYARMFEADQVGASILDDLVQRFFKEPIESDSEKTHLCARWTGRRDVIRFITNRIAQAHAVPQSNEA